MFSDFFKKLKCHKFPRGKQMYYCREMSAVIELTPESISAKICNYKTVAGVNAHSNASANTKRLFKKHSDCTIAEIEKIIATL